MNCTISYLWALGRTSATEIKCLEVLHKRCDVVVVAHLSTSKLKKSFICFPLFKLALNGLDELVVLCLGFGYAIRVVCFWSNNHFNNAVIP